MNTRPSWPITADGCTKDPMGMFGSPMFTRAHGDPITMGDGSGTLFVVGHGLLMSHGAGVFPITAAGTGEVAWDGIGSHPGVGGLRGCTGIMELIMSDGVR